MSFIIIISSFPLFMLAFLDMPSSELIDIEWLSAFLHSLFTDTNVYYTISLPYSYQRKER